MNGITLPNGALVSDARSEEYKSKVKE